MADDDDDDPGQAHLKRLMSEGQNTVQAMSGEQLMSTPAGRGVSGAGSRGSVSGKDASYQRPMDDRDGDYTDEYSRTNFNAGGSKRVNRKSKGDRL